MRYIDLGLGISECNGVIGYLLFVIEVRPGGKYIPFGAVKFWGGKII